MKKILIIVLMLFSVCSFSAEKDVENDVKLVLHAKEIRQLIYPRKIIDGIFTPYAIVFLQGKDIAPSCALLDKKDYNNILELISPSDGQFGNCHQVLQEPIISYNEGRYYATYKYVTEETRADLESEYQVIELKENGFLKCKEDTALSDLIHKYIEEIKIKPSVAIKKAIREVGCTEVPNH
jgi:hypothetical protein